MPNISLNEEDFRTLVSGGVVEKPENDTRIILNDIGFDRMAQALADAMGEGPPSSLKVSIIRPPGPAGDAGE